MAEIKVNITALNRFLNGVVQPYLKNKAEEIVKEAQQNVHSASGELKSSMRVEPGDKGSVRIVVDAPYAGFVHEGTGPQHQPSPNPPYFPRLRRSGLILWAEEKGLNPYKVAQGIAKNGTPANPFLSDALAQVLGKYKFKWIKKDLT